MTFRPVPRRAARWWPSLTLVALLALASLVAPSEGARRQPLHHARDGFRNVAETYSYGWLVRLQGLLTRRPAPEVGVPAVANDAAALRANGHHPTATWLGHASFLIQLDGVNILTDPNWSERASPVSFAGPRRLVPPGIRFEDLPPIHAVIISHDHYDHLDEATVLRLAREHRPRFFVPLGLAAWLADRGVENVVERDWWERAELRGVTFVCTPAQHSSGRGLHDQNERLWASWAVLGAARRLYFAGDTGYYPGLKEIARLGPFDLALLPIGGYSRLDGGHPNHLNPEEAVRLFEDLGARLMVPMHWGTFDLNREPADEPPARLRAAALAAGVERRIEPLRPGQTLDW